MTITIKGLDQLDRELTRFSKVVIPEEVSLLQRKIVFDLLGRIVRKTPVGNPDLWKNPPPPGYVGGRARANWQVEVGVTDPNDRQVDAVDTAGAVTISKGEAVALGAKPFDITWIFNNVPYIVRLENGWSSQAPPGHMIQLSILEVEASVK